MLIRVFDGGNGRRYWQRHISFPLNDPPFSVTWLVDELFEYTLSSIFFIDYNGGDVAGEVSILQTHQLYTGAVLLPPAWLGWSRRCFVSPLKLDQGGRQYLCGLNFGWPFVTLCSYVPHTYRCLLPDAGELSPSDYQNHLTTSLLRLPTKAAHDISQLNRELISRLRSQDYAFSSVKVNFNTVPGVCEALESLASRAAPRRSPNVALVNGAGGGEGGNEEYKDNGGAPISQMHFHCLRFGLITPGTDISEMVQMVLRLANVVEEDSNVRGMHLISCWSTIHSIFRARGIMQELKWHSTLDAYQWLRLKRHF